MFRRRHVVAFALSACAASCGGGSATSATPAAQTPAPPAPITATLRLTVAQPAASSALDVTRSDPKLGAQTALAIEVLMSGGSATVNGSCTAGNGLPIVPGTIIVFTPTGPVTVATPYRTTINVPLLTPFPPPADLGLFDCRITGTDERGGTISATQSVAVPASAIRATTGGCTPGDDVICAFNRFRISATARTAAGQTSTGRVPANGRFNDGGYFWFFDQSNTQTLLQVLNRCSTANRFWVFSTSLTNSEVTITVTDTQHGVQRTYTNPQGERFQPITDTDAFATCP